MQFARRLTNLRTVQMAIRYPLATLSAIGIAATSLAAYFWDVWPGDPSGVALLHPISKTQIALPLQVVNGIGSDVARIALLLSTATVFSINKRIRTAIALTAVCGCTLALVALLKWIIERPRPAIPDDLGAMMPLAMDSFPSGHTTFTVAFCGCLAYLCIHYWPGADLRRKLSIPLLLMLIILIGPARVVAGEHWPSDIIGSYLIALVAIQVFIWAHKRYEVPRATEKIVVGAEKMPNETDGERPPTTGSHKSNKI